MNNRLTVLAADIRATHAAIIRTSVEMAEQVLAAGTMLNEAKAALPHGQWDGWVREHAGLSPRTARRYMQIARSGLETATVADLGIVGATRTVARLRQSSSQFESLNPPDPAYLAWQEEMLRGLAKAPSVAAQHIMLAWMRDNLEGGR